jgi:hypothetical protein
MRCPQCQCSLPDGARFCAFCGIPVRHCAPCDRVYSTDARFCGTCGGSLTKVDQQEIPKVIVDETLRVEDPGSLEIYGYVYELGDSSRQYTLKTGDNTLGAGRNNDIVVNRPAVSWNHALFICRNERVLIQDSASTNGTFVNGHRVRSPMALDHGDIVRFGDQDFKIWLRSNYRGGS